MKYLYPLILESKQLGIIYHYTGIYNLSEMLKYNDFKLKSDMNYISFTRNPSMFSSELRPSKLQCRIAIDGNKLSNFYKLNPYMDIKNDLNREHGEAEERFIKVDDLFMSNSKTTINIKDFIIEIDIMDEPLFMSEYDKNYSYSSKLFLFDPNNYINLDDKESIILKHQEFIGIIKNIPNIKSFNFPINIVSKFLNLKYQDKYIIETINK